MSAYRCLSIHLYHKQFETKSLPDTTPRNLHFNKILQHVDGIHVTAYFAVPQTFECFSFLYTFCSLLKMWTVPLLLLGLSSNISNAEKSPLVVEAIPSSRGFPFFFIHL